MSATAYHCLPLFTTDYHFLLRSDRTQSRSISFYLVLSRSISFINKGQVYSGMRTLDDLAELSGFDLSRLRLTAAATDAQRAPPIAAPLPPSLGITGLGGAPKVVADENCKLSDPNCK